MDKNILTAEETRKKEIAERVEKARQKMMAERRLLMEDAPLITAQLLKGIDYEEPIVVRLKNGEYYKMMIKPLSEAQLLAVFEEIGSERMEKLGTGDTLSIADYNLFWNIVAISTGLEKEDIKKGFAMGESSFAAQRILEISGATGGGVESFR